MLTSASKEGRQSQKMQQIYYLFTDAFLQKDMKIWS